MQMDRRHFFKNFFVVFAGALAFTKLSIANSEERRRARGQDSGAGSTDLPLVKPGVGMAASVNYVEDHKDIKDAKLKTERQGVAFEKQTCSGCLLYTKTKGEGKGEVGKCQLFANQAVKGNAWCTSWAKKA